MDRSQITIGITGGIGSGKSYVSAIIREKFGIPVYDCDKEAKRLTASDAEIRRKLIQFVGPEVFNGEELVRQHLADFLFGSEENARKVNAIIHPAVLRDFKQWARKQQQPIVAMESAILFESGFNKSVDRVLFVDAPEEVRLRRAMQRDSATEQQISARMKMQQPELHRQQANYVVHNSSDDDTRLLVQLTEIINLIANKQ